MRGRLHLPGRVRLLAGQGGNWGEAGELGRNGVWLLTFSLSCGALCWSGRKLGSWGGMVCGHVLLPCRVWGILLVREEDGESACRGGKKCSMTAYFSYF